MYVGHILYTSIYIRYIYTFRELKLDRKKRKWRPQPRLTLDVLVLVGDGGRRACCSPRDGVAKSPKQVLLGQYLGYLDHETFLKTIGKMQTKLDKISQL